MRLGTLYVGGSVDPCTVHDAQYIAQVDVLFLTETWEPTHRLGNNARHDMEVSGPAVSNSNRHQGGVRLLAGSLRLSYRAHYSTENGQVLVAKLPCGLTIVGAYLAPLRGRKAMESIMAWIKPWMRGQAVLLGDINARHLRWDTSRNAYGTALHTRASTNHCKVVAPPEPTLINEHGSSTIDLFITRGVRATSIHIAAGAHDNVTDHHLVHVTVLPPADGTVCRISGRALEDPDRRCKAKNHYKDCIPDLAAKAETTTSLADLTAVHEAWQSAILLPWRDFCRPCPARARRGWTRELDKLAKHRSRFVRRVQQGDESARHEAKALDRLIKRKYRARRRHLDRRPPDRQLNQANESTSSRTPLNELSRNALLKGTPRAVPTPGGFLEHLQSMFRRDAPISRESFEVDIDFITALESAISTMAPGRAAGPDGISPSLLKIEPNVSIRY